MKKKKIAFVIISSVGSSFLNRLLPQLRCLQKRNKYQISLLFLTVCQQYFGKEGRKLSNFKLFLSRLGVKVFCFPVKLKEAHFLVQMILSPLRLVGFFLFWLRHQPDVIHAHSIDAGFISAIFKPIFRYKLIVEIHGAVVEEVKSRPQQKFKPLTVISSHWQEKVSMKRADWIIFASFALGKYFKAKPLAHPPNIVIPSCVIPEDYSRYLKYRKFVRQYLRINRKFVLLFSGDFHHWQIIDNFIYWFKLFDRLIADCFFLILTGSDINWVKTKLLKENIPKDKFYIASLPYYSVHEYLPAGDLGLLIREHSLVNKVASPLKFSEYLAAGVPVLANQAVAQVEDALKRQKRIGFLVKSVNTRELDEKTIERLIDFLKNVKQRRKIVAQTCRLFAENYYNWGKYIGKVIKIYQRL